MGWPDFLHSSVIVFLLLLVLSAWTWAIIDITQNRNMSQGKKVIWILIVLFIAPFLGVVVYFLTKKNWK